MHRFLSTPSSNDNNPTLRQRVRRVVLLPYLR